ncbi:caseinolytic peptidase b protein-like protein [Chrysochromulina tobinii]|uniref:Caseinolytic peptidase b protein-like protein n=1 Tax=Chrysochromulina tobinii TaxID=1460289 RepID=A0A0M0JTZ6_9EUKA|nr:caseinolytic peptidase b protein-like protein [Chrysochromulina tobinii]|eukprot:KOO29822.1 caseinolytic peptidase b protein-like protein [Chrysochromulina sp. CCMP291]
MCEALALVHSTDFPLQRWCWLRLHELQHLTSPMAGWRELSCAVNVGGCPSLVDDVGAVLRERQGLWTLVLIREAQLAPAAAVGTLATRFFQQAKCTHATAAHDTRLDVDCRLVLFALSTSWGAEALAQPDKRSGPRHRLLSSAKGEAAPWLSAAQRAQPRLLPHLLRSAVAVVLGEEPTERFGARMREQLESRHGRQQQQSAQPAQQHVGVDDGSAASTWPDLSVFDRIAGQQSVVSEVVQRLRGIASGADGGQDAHVFFFYGFPGTGKTMLAELVALAQHGRTSPPAFQRFSMQNYKTDEDMWKLVSPPCGVKGEAPVVLFDEIEEARADFMTSALVNAIDHRGFVEFSRKTAEGACVSEHARTAGAFIILTSNCFMDALADVVARQRRAGISEPTALYKATREAMDAMIFDERIPCDAQRGTPNPFAAGKMRDRMRGNLYPFLPLTDPQMVAAFERELEERAKLYNASRRPVGLFWMPEFARLIVRQRGAVLGVDQRGAGAEPPRMRAVVEAATAAARAGGAHDGALGSTVSSSGLTGNDGKSLRKRIEELMRLDERSVERLYARAADACARNGARLARLMLHVANEVPDVAEFCEPLPSTAAGAAATRTHAAQLAAAAERHPSVGTLLAAAAYVVVSTLCFAGSAPACALEAALLEAARWAWWALSWAWQLLGVALGALSGGARLGALALALLFGRSVRRARRAQRDKDAGMQAALSAVLSAHALEGSAWRVAEAQLHAQLSVALRELREIEEAVGAVPSAPYRALTELREIEEAVRAVPSAPYRALTELREIEEAEAVGARHGAQPVAAAAALGGAAGAATRAAAASESGERGDSGGVIMPGPPCPTRRGLMAVLAQRAAAGDAREIWTEAAR